MPAGQPPEAGAASRRGEWSGAGGSELTLEGRKAGSPDPRRGFQAPRARGAGRPGRLWGRSCELPTRGLGPQGGRFAQGLRCSRLHGTCTVGPSCSLRAGAPGVTLEIQSWGRRSEVSTARPFFLACRPSASQLCFSLSLGVPLSPSWFSSRCGSQSLGLLLFARES